MSVTQDFINAVANLLTQRSPTSEYYLKPINYADLLDSNGNIIVSTQDVNVSYQNGVLTVSFEVDIPETTTIAQIRLGTYYNGILHIYFTHIVNQQVNGGNLYEVNLDIVLNNISLVLSPFSGASVDASRLIDLIGNILAGNPLYTGKSGHFVDGIYIVNTVSNVSQSFRVPVSIETTTPTLELGGTMPSSFTGNEVVLRDNNQNDLVIIYSNTPITFKKGRQIIIEFTF